MADTRKANYLVQAWLVLVLASGFGAALAGVHLALNDQIELNKKNETYDQIPKLVPGANKERVVDTTYEVDVAGRTVWRQAYKAIDKEGKLIGWMLRASGMGYVDKIEVLIGVDAKVRRVTGVYVLSQIETPGLGNKIGKPKFMSRFKGKSADKTISVTKSAPDPTGNEIQTITSATISSQSVCNIVNLAVREFREYLAFAPTPRERAMRNIPEMIPGATRKRIEEIPYAGKTIYKALDANGKTLALVLAGYGKGRWSRLDILTAVDAEARTIRAVRAVGQAEIYWKKIVKARYVESYVGKRTETLILVKKRPGDQQIQSVSGATVTSTAICKIVNDTVALLKAFAAGEPGAATTQRNDNAR